MQILNGERNRTLTRCLVCGFAEVKTDEVIDRGLVLLAECQHCEHRWTRRLPGTLAGVSVCSPAHVVRETSSAA